MNLNIPYHFNPMPVYKRGSTEPPTPVDPTTIPLTFTGKSASNAVQLNAVGEPSAIVLNYSKNGGEWTAYTTGTIIELNQNDTIAFSGANDHFSKNYNNYYNFIMTGTIEANNSIQSLMNYSNTTDSACYMHLFSGCTQLTKAPLLPATTLAPECYYQMFENCTSLTSAPQLPATTLQYFYEDCYYGMFHNCSSLTSINVSFTDWNSGYNTSNWVDGVAVNGVFYKPAALNTEYGANYIPVGWTVVNK